MSKARALANLVTAVQLRDREGFRNGLDCLTEMGVSEDEINSAVAPLLRADKIGTAAFLSVQNMFPEHFAKRPSRVPYGYGTIELTSDSEGWEHGIMMHPPLYDAMLYGTPTDMGSVMNNRKETLNLPEKFVQGEGDEDGVDNSTPADTRGDFGW